MVVDVPLVVRTWWCVMMAIARIVAMDRGRGGIRMVVGRGRVMGI